MKEPLLKGDQTLSLTATGRTTEEESCVNNTEDL